jgi:FlaA1/EpsC-like NDP-sugar epimerase
LMYAIAVAFHVDMINLVFAGVFWFSLITITASDRLGVRLVLRQLRVKGKNLRNILIVGSNDAALQFAHKIEQSPWLGYRILGFVDNEWPGLVKFKEQGYFSAHQRRRRSGSDFAATLASLLCLRNCRAL